MSLGTAPSLTRSERMLESGLSDDLPLGQGLCDRKHSQTASICIVYRALLFRLVETKTSQGRLDEDFGQIPSGGFSSGTQIISPIPSGIIMSLEWNRQQQRVPPTMNDTSPTATLAQAEPRE